MPHNLTSYCRKDTALLFFTFFLCISAIGQVNPAFTVNTNQNCTPAVAQVSNTTTGASAAATYKWDFGNTITSAAKDPSGTIYSVAKTYTITLTVTDNGKTYTASQNVIVYKKTTVDFTSSVVKGCLPLPITFTSSSTAGDGTIDKYDWDFGDGTTQRGPNLQQINHTYTAQQNITVKLNVTNSYGCSDFISKNIIQVLAATKAAFTPNATALCRVSDPVTFTNNSTGPGTLSYVWDFGDGTTSTDVSPTHTYTSKNIYTVKLTTTSSEGCTDATTQTINVANFNSDFDAPALICKNNNVVFNNTSSPVPTSTYWQFDDGYSYSLSGGGSKEPCGRPASSNPYL